MSSLRIPVTLEIDLDALKELIRQLDPPGAESAASAEVDSADLDLPASWRELETQHGVTYRWGEDTDTYDPFVPYEAEVGGRTVQLAIGSCERSRTFGADRIYKIVMAIGPAGGMRAVSEFLATDDYDETGEMIAIVKGRDGTAQQFDRAEELPSVYARWTTLSYRSRVDYPGAYSKQALICNEGDHETMLNHTLAQIQLRGL